jgi:hypothetical protein
MDDKPFLEINMLDLKEQHIEELKKFHKSYFDVEKIMSSASELKYTVELKARIAAEFASPSQEFVKGLGKGIYDGMFTAKVIEQFTPLVKRSIQSYINDIISDRLKAAIQKEEAAEQQSETEQNDQQVSKIVTTDDELQAFFIVKAILRQHITSDKITFRDAQSYFSVLFEDNNRKPICRLYLNSDTNKQIAFIGDDKKETKHRIETLDDIYSFAEQLITSAIRYKN